MCVHGRRGFHCAWSCPLSTAASSSTTCERTPLPPPHHHDNPPQQRPPESPAPASIPLTRDSDSAGEGHAHRALSRSLRGRRGRGLGGLGLSGPFSGARSRGKRGAGRRFCSLFPVLIGDGSAGGRQSDLAGVGGAGRGGAGAGGGRRQLGTIEEGDGRIWAGEILLALVRCRPRPWRPPGSC